MSAHRPSPCGILSPAIPVLAAAVVAACGETQTEIEIPSDTVLFSIVLEPDTAFLNAGQATRFDVYFSTRKGTLCPIERCRGSRTTRPSRAWMRPAL